MTAIATTMRQLALDAYEQETKAGEEARALKQAEGTAWRSERLVQAFNKSSLSQAAAWTITTADLVPHGEPDFWHGHQQFRLRKEDVTLAVWSFNGDDRLAVERRCGKCGRAYLTVLQWWTLGALGEAIAADDEPCDVHTPVEERPARQPERSPIEWPSSEDPEERVMYKLAQNLAVIADSLHRLAQAHG